jgi:hypothetical protein
MQTLLATIFFSQQKLRTEDSTATLRRILSQNLSLVMPLLLR